MFASTTRESTATANGDEAGAETAEPPVAAEPPAAGQPPVVTQAMQAAMPATVDTLSEAEAHEAGEVEEAN